MVKIYPTLLAGGSGTRLWPLSRKSYPKQFSKLIGNKTLFQGSALRLISSDLVDFEPHITITNADYRFIVAEQLVDIGIDPSPILIEPEAKNTAAPILAASIFAQSNDRDAIMLVAPSDHIIPDVNAFHEVAKVGLSHTQNGNIVTFGVQPTHAATGYGYLELSPDTVDKFGTSNLTSFVEKPNLSKAESMLNAGNFLWNAGIFMFRAADMIDAFIRYAPNTLDLVEKSVSSAIEDLGFLRLAAEPWSMLDDISIDYAIMEKAQNLVAIPFKAKWSDLGGWDAVWSESNPDAAGNVISTTANAIDCSNTLLRSESASQQVVGIGLENIITVAMPDAVLVAHKDYAQEVKKAVELLKTQEVAQAEVFPKDHRPWGWFESLILGSCFQVKRIHVKPGAALSLQSHQFRSEHWIVVEGLATVTINDQIQTVGVGESVYIPVGVKHRMENNENSPMVLIEVQTGSYLGEDDIVRYEDRYARSHD
jgi:mannose-1-phosphate guanylyltransferase / mannose-6-phosphate isomerase